MRCTNPWRHPLRKKPPTMLCDACWHDLLSIALLQSKQCLLVPRFPNVTVWLWLWHKLELRRILTILSLPFSLSPFSSYLTDHWTLKNLKSRKISVAEIWDVCRDVILELTHWLPESDRYCVLGTCRFFKRSNSQETLTKKEKKIYICDCENNPSFQISSSSTEAGVCSVVALWRFTKALL